MTSKLFNPVQMCKRIKTVLKSDIAILYRFNNKDNRFNWTAGVLDKESNQQLFKIIKNIYIPLSENNILFVLKINEETTDFKEIPDSFVNVYEKETIGKIAGSMKVKYLPLVFENELQGLILIGNRSKSAENIKVPESFRKDWAKNLAFLNERFKKVKIRKNNKNEIITKNKKIKESIVMYLEFSLQSYNFLDSEVLLLQKFQGLVQSIVLESIYGSTSQLLNGYDNSILLYNDQIPGQIPCFLKELNQIKKLIDQSLHQTSNKNIKIRYGVLIGKFYYFRNHKQKSLGGPYLKYLQRLTRIAPDYKIQTNASTAKIIQNWQPLVYRGKVNFQKNSKSVDLYLWP